MRTGSLDEGRLDPLDAVRRRLGSAERCDDPFPHVIVHHVLPADVTALYYFPTPADRADTEGTTLFRASGEIGQAELLARGKTVYFDEAGISTTLAATAPFTPNTLLAFPNTGRSAHGVTISAPGWRRSFQSHLSLKADGAHL